MMKKTGFGLVETLVAVGILTVIAGSTVALAQYVVRNIGLIGEKAQAVELATEGLEIARNIYKTSLIDENAVTEWANNLPCGSVSCMTNLSRFLNKLDSNLQLKSGYEENLNLINGRDSSPIQFTRKITVEDISLTLPAISKTITSRVTWTSNSGKTETVETETQLFAP